MTTIWQHFLLLLCICLLTPSVFGAEKWSRQLEPGGVTDGDSSLDWIPLTQSVAEAGGSSKDRSENGRVLSYSQTFPPNARFVDFAKPPAPPLSQPQSYEFPYQFQRFPHSPLKAGSSQSQEPTSQSFFKFEMPFRSDGGRHPNGAPPLQTGYQIQHSFGNGQGQATLYSSQLFNNQPLYNTDYRSAGPKPVQQPIPRKPSLPQQNYIDEALPLKNPFRESKPTQQSLQSVTPQVFPLNPKPEPIFQVSKANAFPSQQQAYHAPNPISSNPSANRNPQQEEVQLVYVPYDTYFNKQQQAAAPGFELNRFNLNAGLPAVNPYQINQFYTQDPLAGQEPNFFTTTTTTTNRPKTTSASPNLFQSFAAPQFTTVKPKPKAHQPPLAMFLLRNKARPSQSDVVSTLRNSETIDVIDGPAKDTPSIFVGPAGMPIPDGFVKFDLPYLSQLAQTRNLNEVPFFVAPLSYRTPNGFNKILLPEPHVGSIVVNRAKDTTATASQSTYAPEQIFNDYPVTTQRPRTQTQRVKEPSSTKNYYPKLLRDPGVKTRTQYDGTTQRTPTPVRGNKYSYYADQDVLPEITKTKAERPKKKRPQTVQVEQPTYAQPNSAYTQYNSVPNQIVNDDFYKIQSSKAPTTTSTSTSTSTTTTTTSTLPPPTTYFPYNSSPQVEFHSSSGQLYPSYNTIVNEQNVENAQRYTTRPSTTPSDEEYRAKQYYRQHRPQNQNPTYSPFEQVQYTPIEVTIPSSTVKPGKQRFTFYSPMETTTPLTAYDTVPPQEPTEKTLPANHRPSYNPNEISDANLEYEPNPYQLPSELPPLTPNLPGLVNDLQEKHKAQLAEQTTPLNEVEIPTRPTRRPIQRVRKPTKVTSSVSYSESETTVKRPSQRVRRPYGTRGSTDVNSEYEETEATTRRISTVTRNPLLRNPNRIRYQPTPEERQNFRLKPKKGQKGSKNGDAPEDLDYQRDVLKQNYPVFRQSSSSRKTTSPTAIPSSYAVTTTEGPTSETQQVYTVTPSNEQIFPAGMLEPMQIAQQYNQYSKDNYGPGYFPNQEDLNPTEPVRNEINPIYTASTTPSTTTSTTKTTEPPQTTTKRSLFVRRNYPRLRPTTTEAPITTTQIVEERSTARSRLPPRKVIKVRTRNRRPTHPASSTKTPTEDDSISEPVKNNYRKVNRFNQDLYENDTPKRRYKTQFHLEGQESQWSPSTNERSNSFSPIDSKETDNKDKHDFQSEPDIVTVGPVNENKRADTYEVNVSADYGSKSERSNFHGPNLKPEKSFAELLEEVMGKAPVEKPLEDIENESTTKTTDGTYFESQKTTIGDKLNRRGKWKKLRNQASNHQNDSFEAAESQNIGEQLLNRLYTDRDKLFEKMKTTTPIPPLSETTTQSQLPITEFATVNSFDPFATNQPETTTAMDLKSTIRGSEGFNPETMLESATRRLDVDVTTVPPKPEDLDSEPSIFSEVKKQLHDLFAFDDSEDQAVTAALSAVKRRHEYTNIKRTRPPPTTSEATSAEESASSTTAALAFVGTTTTAPAQKKEGKEEKVFKNPMDHLVYATSTATKVTSETEICYRGRCIRSEDLPRNHKLQ